MTTLKKSVCILLIIGIISSLCSCTKENTPVSADKSAEETVIEWMIFDPFSRFSGKWKDYSILRDITEATGIIPEIEIVSSDFNSALSKCLLSESFPDMMTFLLDDTNLLKAFANLPHAVFEPGSALYESIDESIRSFHLQDDGTLSYIPGGFCNDNTQALIANEGIYVYNEAYQAYGSAIESFDDLTEFIKGYLDSEDIPEITDVMLLDDKGFYTLEHLFGIMPSCITEFNIDNLNSSVYSPMLSLLKNFSDAGISGNSIEYSPERTPLIFIGSSAAIYSRHTAGGKALYTPLNICGSDNGFLSGYSKYGSYATLITENSNRNICEELVNYMISTDISRIMMYGEENINWVIDESNKRITLISDTVERMRQNDRLLLRSKGISVFPYVSSCYAVYPDSYNYDMKIKDILKETKSVFSDPTLDPGKTYREKLLALKELYLFTLARDS